MKLHFKEIQVQIQVYKESNISACHNYFVCLFFIQKVLTYEIKWNKFYSDSAHMCLIVIVAIA